MFNFKSEVEFCQNLKVNQLSVQFKKKKDNS